MSNDSYFSCLSKGLMHLYQEGLLLDASIHSADGPVGIHSIILLIFSEHYQQKAKKGNNISEIDARGYKEIDVKGLVNLLYGSVNDINTDVTELIKFLKIDLCIDQKIRKKKQSKGESIKSLIELELKVLRDLVFKMTLPKLAQHPKCGTDVVTVKTDQHLHYCHKVVLAAMSEYFEVMFSSGMKECQDSVTINLQGVDTKAFNTILSYMYTGNIHLSVSNAQELLSTTVYLQIHILQEEIERFLLSQLDYTNCLDMYNLGELYSCQMLMQGSWAYVVDNFQRLSKLKLAKELGIKDAEKLCADENLNVNDESLVLRFVLDWLSRNSVEEQAVKSLLACVRFGLIEESYLQDILEQKDNVVSNKMIKSEIKEIMSKDNVGETYLPRKENVFVIIKRSSYTTGIEVACYSLTQKRWFVLNGMPKCAGGTGFSSCVGNDTIFVTGGTATPKESFYYDINTNSWYELPEMSEGRSSHGSGYVNGCLYVFGGSEISSGAFTIVSSIEKYNTEKQAWSKVGQMEIPTYDSAYAVVKSRIYIFGGSMGLMSGVYIKDIQCFDTVTSTCCIIYHHLPFTLSLAIACCNDRDIYITCPNGKMLYYTEDSAPVVISEARGSQLMGYATLYHNQSVYIMGGYSTIGETDMIQRFDLKQKKEVPYSQTKLPFKKETNQMFGAVFHISRKFLSREYPSPAEKNAKRRVPLTSRR